MFDVLSLGELLIDFISVGQSDRGSLLFEMNPGGAPANVLAALANWGKRTALISKVGNDFFGIFLQNVMKKLDVELSGLVLANDVNTTLAFVYLDEKGNRSFDFWRRPGSDMTLSQEEINFKLIDKTKIFHFGSVSLTHEPSRSATFKAIDYAKMRKVIISCDLNLRPQLWNNLIKARQIIHSCLTYVDILKLSEEEFIFLTDTCDLRKGSKYLDETFNIPVILITLGERGCFYRAKEVTGHFSAYNVRVVDTTGAGDMFMAGILYQLLEIDKSIFNLSKSDLMLLVDFANAAGSLATTRRGAIPAIPSLTEIYACCNQKNQLVFDHSDKDKHRI